MTTIPLNAFEAGDRAAIASGYTTQEVITITPSIATNLLMLNVKNRPVSPQSVEKYRRDMVSGRWVYAADPIRFDVHGNLLDGQHRLTALSLLEGEAIALPFLIIRGLPAETQMVMDQGRKRNAGQQLSIKGVKNAANVAAGVKVYLLWKGGYLFRDSKAGNMAISTPQIEEWVAANSDLVAWTNGHMNAIRQSDAPPSVGLAAAFRFAQIDPTGEEQFFQTLASGGMPVKHPINTLDKRLQRIRREGLKMPNRDYLALYILAWNAAREGRSLAKFLRPSGGAWNEDNFPEPR